MLVNLNFNYQDRTIKLFNFYPKFQCHEKGAPFWNSLMETTAALTRITLIRSFSPKIRQKITWRLKVEPVPELTELQIDLWFLKSKSFGSQKSHPNKRISAMVKK